MLRHFAEGRFPRYGLKAAGLVEFAVLHAHQGLSKTVLAVHDLGVEITLYAVEAAVHRGFRVSLGGNDAAVAHADHQAAAGAAEAADGFVPADALVECICVSSLGCGDGNAERKRGACGDARLEHRTGVPGSCAISLRLARPESLLKARHHLPAASL